VFNQNHGAIAEAMAKREQAAVQFMALQDQVIGDADRAIADYAAARGKLETAGALLSVHAKQDERLRKLLHPGDLSRLTLFRAQLDLDSTRLLAADARVQFHQAEGALEDALGQPLPGRPESLPNLETNPRPLFAENSHAE
jgi:outer membrane protein TolC